jgi:hypothetical protein
MKKRVFLPAMLFVLWMLFVALACNLTGDTAPPTLVPRATSTPPPTIGYATLSPEELPEQAATQPPGGPRTETTLLNLINQVEPDRLFLHIDSLQQMFTRHVNSPDNLADRGIGAAYNYVNAQFAAIRDASQGRFVLLPPHEFVVEWANVQTIGRNVVGLVQGTETGAGVIVVGAHYDSTSNAYEDGNAYAPGANDNASGVAAMLELARIMSQRSPRATIMFVAFGAEEFGRQGSIAFVQDYLLANNIKIDAMLNMDIIGSSTGPDGSIDDERIRLFSEGPNESPSRQLGRTVDLLVDRHVPNMTVELQSDVDRAGRYSDHMSFSEAGYPAVRFIEMLENPNRNHNNMDTLDGIRASYLMRATQSVLASLAVLADGPRPPRNITLRDDGNGLRTLVWERTSDATSYIVALRRPNSLIYDNYFETSDVFVQWDGFVASRFVGIAISALDSSGLMGPFSAEYTITS